MKKSTLNKLKSIVKIPSYIRDTCSTSSRKHKISDKSLKNLIRFCVRVLDTKEARVSKGSDLGILLIENICSLKPPKKTLADLLVKSLKKLQKLNPWFIPLLMGKDNRNFSVLVYASSIKNKRTKPATDLDDLRGNTIHFGKGKVMILLNTTALGFYSEDVFFHELLHVTDDLIVPDKGNKKKYFHEVINQKYDNILSKIAKDYKQKQKKAYSEFARWLDKTAFPLGHKEQVALLKQAIERIYYDKYKLWAADENLAEEILSTKRFLGKEIDSSDEVFSYGLQYYLASAHKRKILKKRIPELYNLIKDVIVPVLKSLRPG